MFWDSPGTSRKLGLTGCPEDPMRDVLGQFWDILQGVGNIVIGLSEKEYPMTLWKIILHLPDQTISITMQV